MIKTAFAVGAIKLISEGSFKKIRGMLKDEARN